MSSENVTRINVSIFGSHMCQCRGSGSSRVYVQTYIIINNNNNNNNNNLVPTHSSVHHSTRGLIVLLQQLAGVVLWQFPSRRVRILPTPRVFISGYANTGKKFSIAFIK